MADSALIQARATALDATLAADSRLSLFTTMAITTHTKAAFSAVYIDAMACWVLHRLIMAQREAGGVVGPAGPIQSQRTGDISVSYQGVGMSGVPGEDYVQTSWGRMYLVYRKARPTAHAGVISASD